MSSSKITSRPSSAAPKSPKFDITKKRPSSAPISGTKVNPSPKLLVDKLLSSQVQAITKTHYTPRDATFMLDTPPRIRPSSAGGSRTPRAVILWQHWEGPSVIFHGAPTVGSKTFEEAQSCPQIKPVLLGIVNRPRDNYKIEEPLSADLPQVFISYNWHEETTPEVWRFVSFLRQMRIFRKVWLDRDEPPRLAVRRQQAVAESDVVVVFLDSNYEASIQRRIEAETAMALHKPLVFINMETTSEFQRTDWLMSFISANPVSNYYEDRAAAWIATIKRLRQLTSCKLNAPRD